MPNRIEQIREHLAVLQPAQLDIADDSHLHAGARSGGGHYRLSMVSAQFVGKPTLERHRMIYSALHEMMRHDIHALNISAYAPDEVQPENFR